MPSLNVVYGACATFSLIFIIPGIVNWVGSFFGWTGMLAAWKGIFLLSDTTRSGSPFFVLLYNTYATFWTPIAAIILGLILKQELLNRIDKSLRNDQGELTLGGATEILALVNSAQMQIAWLKNFGFKRNLVTFLCVTMVSAGLATEFFRAIIASVTGFETYFDIVPKTESIDLYYPKMWEYTFSTNYTIISQDAYQTFYPQIYTPRLKTYFSNFYNFPFEKGTMPLALSGEIGDRDPLDKTYSVGPLPLINVGVENVEADFLSCSDYVSCDGYTMPGIKDSSIFSINGLDYDISDCMDNQQNAWDNCPLTNKINFTFVILMPFLNQNYSGEVWNYENLNGIQQTALKISGTFVFGGYTASVGFNTTNGNYSMTVIPDSTVESELFYRQARLAFIGHAIMNLDTRTVLRKLGIESVWPQFRDLCYVYSVLSMYKDYSFEDLGNDLVQFLITATSTWYDDTYAGSELTYSITLVKYKRQYLSYFGLALLFYSITLGLWTVTTLAAFYMIVIKSRRAKKSKVDSESSSYNKAQTIVSTFSGIWFLLNSTFVDIEALKDQDKMIKLAETPVRLT
jgi:hypothetical protein